MASAAFPWWVFALGSACFAAMTAILGKLGVAEINSNLATLIRTLVIIVMVGMIVTMNQQWEPVSKLSRVGVGALVLSAMATGLSWLCYYRALQLAPASRVAPVDKLSVVLVVLLGVAILGEKLTWKLALGTLFISVGAVLVAL